MGKRSPLIAFFLSLINSIFILSGLGIVSYALYCLLKLKAETLPHVHKKYEIARALLASDHDISKWLSCKLPTAWLTLPSCVLYFCQFIKKSPFVIVPVKFIYLLLIIGASLVIISCFGCIGIATRSPCCLCFHSLLLAVLFAAQLGAAAFIFFNHDWKQDIPTDRSGSFSSTYHFFSTNWKIIKWVAIGALVLEAIAIALVLYLRYVSRVSYHTDYQRTIIYPDVTRRNSEKRRSQAAAAPPACGKQEIKAVRPSGKPVGEKQTR